MRPTRDAALPVLRRVKQAQPRHMLGLLRKETIRLWGAYKRWQNDDGALMAAAVAYYLGLSFFPLLLVVIAGVGLFLEYSRLGQSAEDQVLAALAEHLAPALRDQVRDALAQVKDRSALNGPVALAGLVIAAMVVFTQFDRAFDRIWTHREPEEHGVLASMRNVLVNRGVAFLMLLGMGLIVVIIFLAGLVLAAIQRMADDVLPAPNFVWTLAQIGMTVSLNTLVFTLLYRWLPKPDVRWGDALRGALVAAVGWEVGRHVLAFFVVSKYSSAYGVIGSFIAILLWSYYAMIVVFLGAEYIQELLRERDEEFPQPPLPPGRSQTGT